MSRKMILAIAAAATVAVATLASQSADARGFGGRIAMARGVGSGAPRPILNTERGRGRIVRPIIPGRITRLCVLGRPCRPPGPPIWWHHHHHHHHWVFRSGRWIIDDVVEAAPVVAAPVAAPDPCTCLTKTYTPTGLVVFADICTKESASAPVDSAANASQVPTTAVAATAVPISVVPTTPNYAGRTYEDYLAANPQAVEPQAANPAPANAQKN